MRLGLHGAPAYIRADPVPRGGSLGEVRLLQPAIMAHGGALGDRLRLTATVNLEGLTPFWSVSLGARLRVGAPMHRMGRDGVAQDTARNPSGGHHKQHDH